MKIDDLLMYWAEWRSRRDDELSYGSSRFNRLMSGEAALSSSACFGSELPYGLDGDGVGFAVDRAYCRLTTRQKEVVFWEYCRVGTQAQKAAGLRQPISQACFARHLSMAKVRLKADPLLKRYLD